MRVATLVFLILIRLSNSHSAQLYQDKTPVEIGLALGEIKKQKPTLSLVAPAQDYFESIKVNPFRRVNPLDYSQIEEVPRFISVQNRVVAPLEVTAVDPQGEVKRRMLFAKDSFAPQLLVLDDFFPMMPGDQSRFVSELSRLVFLHNGRDVDDINEKSQVRQLNETSPVSASFQKQSIFGYPLGYADFTGAVAIHYDVFPIYYNLLARQTWEFFRDLQRAREATGEETEEVVYLDDLNFSQFLQLAKRERLLFYYPDPQATATRKEGLIFINQLLYWLDPALHESFLNSPKSATVLRASKLLKDFFNQNSSVFKPLSSLDALREAATSNNVLANLPSGFDPENPAFDFQLPGTYDLMEQEHRLAFAFIPESHVIPHFAKAAFEVRNSQILAEKERVRQAEIEAKRERERLRKERMKRNRRNQEADEEAGDEEPESGDSSSESGQSEEEQATPSWPRHEGQLTTYRIDKVATLRSYLAIPAHSPNKEAGLYAIHALLLHDVQRAMALQPAYLRPVKPGIFPSGRDLEVFVLRLISADDRETRKENQFFGIPFRFPHQEGLDHALPMLNTYYMRALEATLWDR